MIRYILRGGSHDYDFSYLRSAYRVRSLPESRGRRSGFRLVVRRAE